MVANYLMTAVRHADKYGSGNVRRYNRCIMAKQLPGRERPFHRAFTLIEMLVVISIMAVLIALLLPALGMAHQLGMSTQCLSNLRSMGQILNEYATSYQDAVPFGYDPGGNTGNDWYAMLFNYNESQQSGAWPPPTVCNMRLLICMSVRQASIQPAMRGISRMRLIQTYLNMTHLRPVTPIPAIRTGGPCKSSLRFRGPHKPSPLAMRTSIHLREARGQFLTGRKMGLPLHI